MLNGVYRFPAMESVIFGKPYAEALGQEVDRVEARAVFILASGTLARETDTVERLRYTYIDPYGVALGYEDVFTKLEQITSRPASGMTMSGGYSDDGARDH